MKKFHCNVHCVYRISRTINSVELGNSSTASSIPFLLSIKRQSDVMSAFFYTCPNSVVLVITTKHTRLLLRKVKSLRTLRRAILGTHYTIYLPHRPYANLRILEHPYQLPECSSDLHKRSYIVHTLYSLI